MKLQHWVILAAAAGLWGCNQQAAEQAGGDAAIALETEQQRVSYGMGLGLGERIQQDGFPVDVDAFAEGMRNGMGDGEPLMTAEEIQQEMMAFQQKQVEKQQQEMEQMAAENLQRGLDFLAENAAKEGVVTLESGLQYKIIEEAEGDVPAAEDIVEVHYRGTLVDGTEFDSSYSRQSTVSFPVNGVIPGWTEALQLMPVGSKWELYIPSELAYGPGGTGGGPIGPNEALIFEVELVSIQDQNAESSPQ